MATLARLDAGAHVHSCISDEAHTLSTGDTPFGFQTPRNTVTWFDPLRAAGA
jgi:hypothetical protein